MEALKWQKGKLRKRQQRKNPQRRKERRKNKHLRILCCHIAINAYALMAFLFARSNLHFSFHCLDNHFYGL